MFPFFVRYPMRVFVSYSNKRIPKVSRKKFDTFSQIQKDAYLKAYPHSSHGKAKKSSKSEPKQETKSEPKQEQKQQPKQEKKTQQDNPFVNSKGNYVPPKQDKTKVENEEFKDLKTSNKKSLKRKISESVFDGMKFRLNEITKVLREPKADIMKALNEPSTKHMLNAAGGSIKALAKASLEVLKVPNTALGKTFEELHKTDAFKKLQKGTMKVDEFLKKYPTIKKIGGGLMAGAMIYQWLNMSFSGDFDDDFNIEHIGEALQGNYSVEQFVASPSGAKALAQLATGIATGGMASFPWHSAMNITFAAIYTAAKRSNNKDLMKKAQEQIRKSFNKKAQAQMAA